MLVDASAAAAIGAAAPYSLTWQPTVTAWLQGRFLATVPISSGRVVWSSKRQVPGSLEITVPLSTYGTDWVPRHPDHPLAAKGQVLRVQVTVGTPSQSWDVPLGVFVVTRSEVGPGAVRVSGQSLMLRAERARLTSPLAPRSGGTLASEFRRLLPADLGLSVAGGLTDRDCPAMSWGESRIDALYEVVDAWPARLREGRTGTVSLLEPLADAVTTAPTYTLTDGVGGTVVEAFATDDSAGIYNVVVARGTDSTDAGLPSIQSVARQISGPYGVDRYGEVPFFFSSPLITSEGAAAAAAETRLASVVRQARTVPVVCAPDPRWDLDDTVEILTGQAPPALVGGGALLGAPRVESRWWGFVSGVDLPLTVADGDMRLDVEVS